MILQKSDFEKGEFSVSQSKYGDLQTFIDKYEPKILIELLGKDLYDEFQNDLTTDTPQIPQTDKFKNIFNPIYGKYESDGIIEMLKKFIFFYYVREQAKTKTVDGIKTATSELTKTNVSIQTNVLISAFNSGVQDYKNIQWYMVKNKDVYTEFCGQIKKFISF